MWNRNQFIIKMTDPILHQPFLSQSEKTPTSKGGER